MKRLDKRRAALLQAIPAVLVSAALGLAQFYVGLLYGSAALVGSALHTAADAFTSVGILLGYRLASRPADERHPFGHWRAEQVMALALAMLLIFGCVEVIRESVGKLLARAAPLFGASAVVVLIATAVSKELLARWSERLGREAEAAPLVAEAWHHRTDVFTSLVVLAGLLLSSKAWWIDPILGLILSSLILRVSLKLARSSADELLGLGATREEMERLREIVETCSPSAREPHEIKVHRYGSHVEITLHVKMPSDMSLEEAHSIADKIERAIKEKIGWEATVHLEPEKSCEKLERGDKARGRGDREK
ncbi:MAG: cation diffusion facilitator family transporter [Fervidicoccaceae archaeon]